MTLKEKLFAKCILYVEKWEETVNTTITSAQKALTSETKSSAGDKHETGRAMLQLEMEKTGKQLHGITLMKEVLAKIQVNETSSIAHLGSLIITNKGKYYLSVSVGKITINTDIYFAISVSSPIGKLLLGKKKDEAFLFNGQKIVIDAIL